MKKLLEKMRIRIRLWRIEKALGIRLHNDQRDYVLCNRAGILYGGRRNGKTIAVIVKILLFRKQPIRNRGDFSPAISDDPDLEKNIKWHFDELLRYQRICEERGIKVFEMDSCALLKNGIYRGGE